jgi:hypothetical protein
MKDLVRCYIKVKRDEVNNMDFVKNIESFKGIKTQ